MKDNKTPITNKKNYLSVVYNSERTPKTNYPNQLTNYLIDRFKLKKGETLLEIGCGRGDFLREFKEAGLQTSGLDREESSIDISRDLDIQKCNVSKDTLPFNDNSIDIVYHKSFIEHLADPAHLMSETVRILKPGGKLIILTPDWHSQMKNFYEDFTHSRPYDTSAIMDLLQIYGFRNSLSEKFYQLPINWRFSYMKALSQFSSFFIGVYMGRWLTKKTGIGFFRWSTELMVLGYGEKPADDSN